MLYIVWIHATYLMHGVNLSYDLDLDTRLSEETTVLVENYTVSLTSTLE